MHFSCFIHGVQTLVTLAAGLPCLLCTYSVSPSLVLSLCFQIMFLGNLHTMKAAAQGLDPNHHLALGVLQIAQLGILVYIVKVHDGEMSEMP